VNQKTRTGKNLRNRVLTINQKSKIIKKSTKLHDDIDSKPENAQNSASSQSGTTTNIINNISNNNNNYNKNYNVTYSTVENITQNFYITLEHNHQAQNTTQKQQSAHKETSSFINPSNFEV
jgi:hypothetical protein